MKKTSFQKDIVNVYGAEWRRMHACREKEELSGCPTVAVLLTAQNIAAASLSVSTLHCSKSCIRGCKRLAGPALNHRWVSCFQFKNARAPPTPQWFLAHTLLHCRPLWTLRARASIFNNTLFFLFFPAATIIYSPYIKNCQLPKWILSPLCFHWAQSINHATDKHRHSW